MKPILPVLLLILGLGSALFAEPVTPPSVFLDSEPMGAKIQIDGTLIQDRTPALIRGLAPGPHQVSFWSEGFAPVTQTFQVAEGEVPIVEVTLPSESVVLAFPAQPQVFDSQGVFTTQGRQFRYPSGTYRIEDQNGSAVVVPVFPDENLMTFAGWGLALTAGAALTSTFSDVYHYRTGWIEHPSLLTAGLWTSTLLTLPWYLTAKTRQDRFLRESVPAISPLAERLDRAPALMDNAETALQSGELDTAASVLAQLIRDHPQSRLVPGAWFRLARIHQVTGRRELALAEYRLLADYFPQAAYHDRARQALADLYEVEQNQALALENLENMVLSDDLFDQATIEAQKKRLEAALPAEPEAAAPGTEVDESSLAESTPRQALQQAELLYAQGHHFTAEDWSRLQTLRERLVDGGDRALAQDLDVLMLGVLAVNQAAEGRSAALQTLPEDSSRWMARDILEQDRRFWRNVRDGGMIVFTVSAAATLFLAVINDRNEAASESIYDKDWSSRRQFSDGMHWAMLGTAVTMGLSIFPLVWGEARQD